MNERHLPGWLLLWSLTLAISCPTAFGQATQKKKQPGVPLPKARAEALTTKDGVHLRCIYYESPLAKKQGKQVFPVVLVHGWGRGAADFHYLAQGLQGLGFSLAVPDLRGHGKSVTRSLANGNKAPITRQRMKPKDKAAVRLDLQAVKSFLLEENNAGRMNIEKLCVVGAAEGALLAMNWALYDWSRQDLPAFEIGKDIRGLILLSPPKSFGRFNAQGPLQHQFILRQMPMLIAVGQGDRTASKDAERLYSKLEGRRKGAGNTATGLFVSTANTNLQGAELLNPRLPITKGIVDFMKLMRRQSDRFPAWTEQRFQ